MLKLFSLFNHAISRYFGLGIFVTIGLALIFPYFAYSLSPWSLILLFLLMYFSGFGIEWNSLGNIFTKFKLIIVSLVFIFGIIPVIVYVFASVLLTEKIYVYGLVFSALTPTAAVAPFFAGILKSNKELSFIILIVSMILAPFILPVALMFAFGNYLNISGLLIFKDVLILVPLPVFLAWLTKRYFGKGYIVMKNSLPSLNFFLLGLLVFVQFGTSIMKLPSHYINIRNITAIVLIVFIQDFILFLFAKFFLRYLKNKQDVITILISSSMKNIAIASTILLLYSPKAAIAPALGFIPHALLFLPILIRPLIIKTTENARV